MPKINIESIREYIKRGANLDIGLIRSYILLLSFLFVFSMLFGFFSKNTFALIISIVMQIISLVFIPIIFGYTKGQYTIRKRLITNILISTFFSINFTLFSITIYICEFQLDFMVPILFILPIICGCLFYIFSIVKGKIISTSSAVKDKRLPSIYRTVSGIGAIGIAGGILGTNLAKLALKDVTISSSLIFVIPFISTACILTLSVGNIVKLGYMKKLQKIGVDINENITSGIRYVKR